VYKSDGTFKTLAVKESDSTKEILEILRKKHNLISVEGYHLYELTGNQERKMGIDEQPLVLAISWDEKLAQEQKKC